MVTAAVASMAGSLAQERRGVPPQPTQRAVDPASQVVVVAAAVAAVVVQALANVSAGGSAAVGAS